MLLIFFFLYKINLFKTVFQEHHQSVKLFGFRLNRWQRLLISIAGKELVLKYCLCVRNMKNIWHEVLFGYFHKKRLLLFLHTIDKGVYLGEQREQSQIFSDKETKYRFWGTGKDKLST